jgi:hypothetical protein
MYGTLVDREAVLHKPTNEVGSDTLITCMENKHGNGIYGHGQSCARVSKDPCPSMVVTVQNSARVLPVSDKYRQQAMTGDYRLQTKDPESNQTRLD